MQRNDTHFLLNIYPFLISHGLPIIQLNILVTAVSSFMRCYLCLIQIHYVLIIQDHHYTSHCSIWKNYDKAFAVKDADFPASQVDSVL
jgi:hypothetical protein